MSYKAMFLTALLATMSCSPSGPGSAPVATMVGQTNRHAGNVVIHRDNPTITGASRPSDEDVKALAEAIGLDMGRDDWDISIAANWRPSFQLAKADLDEDGTDEYLVLYSSRSHCGSGGCSFRIFRRTAGSFAKVSGSTITRTPISVLPSKTKGWHDLTVWVCGGGVDPCFNAVMRFDGARYPLNPSTQPPLEDIGSGTVLLTEDSSAIEIPRLGD